WRHSLRFERPRRGLSQDEPGFARRPDRHRLRRAGHFPRFGHARPARPPAPPGRRAAAERAVRLMAFDDVGRSRSHLRPMTLTDCHALWFRKPARRYKISRGSAVIDLRASAYFTPQVLPRYRAIASFVCWAPSSSPPWYG